MNQIRTRGLGAGFAALLVLLGAAACSSGTEVEERPTEARIRVTGTTPVPLQLVVSTDFSEFVGEEGQILQRINSADTTFISPPYDETVLLTSLGSIVVALTNHDVEPAQVELRVNLDNGEDFRQSAAMSEGGTLRYVFVFLTTIL